MDLAIDPPAAAGSSGRGRIKVLVVDDNLDHRTLMARRLSAAGMRVSAVGVAEQALEACVDVDLVLLDYRLPGRDGLEVLAAIQARPHPPSVIMVTAAGSTEVAVAAMRAGAANYLAKDRGYIEALPDVVERAWHHHDLAKRADELKRAALLLTSTTDREQLSIEVAGAAHRLLHATSCVLLLEEDGQPPTVAAVAGVPPADLGEAEQLAITAGSGAEEPWVEGDRLVVPLPTHGGGRAGVLVVWLDDPHLDADEEELARAIAAFAGAALRNARRLELERQLVTELQQTLDARRDFVASVSHELRTPLTSIAGFTETLRVHGERLDSARRDDLLARVGRHASELGELVDELLELAALERGVGSEPALQVVDLPAAVDAIVAELEHVTRGWHVEVAVPSVSVYADPTLLRRTLANLLSNAVKFSEPETRVVVHAAVEGPWVRIEVEDRGIGLPPWEASHVFDPFFRARSSVSNAVRGSGIGLALVARYVRAMGGEVSVRSEPGEGSTFAFTLPTTVARPGPDSAAGPGCERELA
ncbi:MAG: hybrid sensor histidine kinase/response regulator [Nitriliruptor sp.]|uniref:ATP-binding response regulator n=1 Tax=Nitriliruptor sp. TaxID=2448056 RepID=UPI00349FE688